MDNLKGHLKTIDKSKKRNYIDWDIMYSHLRMIVGLKYEYGTCDTNSEFVRASIVMSMFVSCRNIKDEIKKEFAHSWDEFFNKHLKSDWDFLNGHLHNLFPITRIVSQHVGIEGITTYETDLPKECYKYVIDISISIIDFIEN